MTVTLKSAAPIIAVADVRRSVAFYVRVFGFAEDFVMEDGSYGIVRLGGAAIHFTRTDDAAALAATASNVAAYLDVTGLDALWARVTAAGPGTRTRPPEDMPWGVREFHILDPDGALLRFGEDR